MCYYLTTTFGFFNQPIFQEITPGWDRLANSGFGHSGTPSPPFLFPPLPSLLSPPLPPSLSSGAPSPKPARGLGSAVSSPGGVWGEAPADK